MVCSLLYLNKVACTKRGRKGSRHCGHFDVLPTCPYVSRQARWPLPPVLELFAKGFLWPAQSTLPTRVSDWTCQGIHDPERNP